MQLHFGAAAARATAATRRHDLRRSGAAAGSRGPAGSAPRFGRSRPPHPRRPAERPPAEERGPHIAVAVRRREHRDLVAPRAELGHLVAGVRADAAVPRRIGRDDQDPSSRIAPLARSRLATAAPSGTRPGCGWAPGSPRRGPRRRQRLLLAVVDGPRVPRVHPERHVEPSLNEAARSFSTNCTRCLPSNGGSHRPAPVGVRAEHELVLVVVDGEWTPPGPRPARSPSGPSG